MITNYLPALPIIIMLLASIVAFICWHFYRIQKLATVLACAILLCVSLLLLYEVSRHQILIAYISDWQAPFGITLVVDKFSAMMLLLTAIVGLCVAIYSCADLNHQHIASGFYPSFCILLVGLCGAFATGDFFNLYVWFEVTVIGSFVLMSCGGRKIQLDGTVRYVVINLLATLILLTAIALIYGVTGTLNMADVARDIANMPSNGLITAISLLLVLALAVKAALFPLFFWLPASYHTPSFSASAIFAGLLSKLGVYALIRVCTLVFAYNTLIHNMLWVLGLLTLIIGILGAINQSNLRRILSFTLISHIGYMIVGLVIGTPLAIAAAVFYLFQHVLVKVSLFMTAGIIERYAAHHRLRKISALYRLHPWLAILFLIPALALAGFPPSSGFWAKVMLIMAAARQNASITIIVMLFVSLLTLYIIKKIWLQIFLRDQQKQLPKPALSQQDKLLLFIPTIILLVLIVIISLDPVLLFNFTRMISEQLLHPQQYINLVLRGIS